MLRRLQLAMGDETDVFDGVSECERLAEVYASIAKQCPGNGTAGPGETPRNVSSSSLSPGCSSPALTMGR